MCVCFICFIAWLWNCAHLIYGFSYTDSPPDFLEFLDSLHYPSYGFHFVDYSQLYYAIQSSVMFFAICPGLVIDSFFFLTPLAVSETLMLLMYLIKILTYLWLRINLAPSTENPLKLLILFAFHYYFCSSIFSFFSQLSKGEHGCEHRLTINVKITKSTQDASSLRASAPCSNDETFLPVSQENSSYATKTPEAPVFTQPPSYVV
ncbi:uncharacterized protein LOC135834512 [Planococcus citri]|uniref:uncharacterized protein LOC135834512 n=1 Tax=Planococcus citri TaxID=170843 RepID=UPI0031F9F52F